MTIARAIDALERDDVDEAYRELVAAWRVQRSDALALAAAEVWRAAPRRSSIDGAQWIDRWSAVAATRDPVDVPRLVATVVRASIHEVIALLPDLEPFADDPMLAFELARALKDVRWYSLRAIVVYRLVCGLVRHAVGPRELPFLEEALLNARRREPTFRGELIDLLNELIFTIRERLAIDADVSELRRALAELHARQVVRADRTRALFAAVYAAPADDGPRLALADHLLEADDPRGELIALQCQRAPLDASQTARVAELLMLHASTWIRDTPILVRVERVEFERGFPATISWHLDGRTIGAPEWSTIRSVTLRHQQEPARELFDPVCASLETVHGLDAATMSHAVTSTRPTTIVTLGFRHADHGFDHLPSALHVFPRLRELHVHDGFELVTIGRVLTRRPLERLVVHGTLTPDHVGLLGSHLAELVAINRSYTLRFTREDPDTGFLAFDDHGWEELRRLDLAVAPRRLVIDRLDAGDCEDCQTAICSDAELAAQLGCPVEWR